MHYSLTREAQLDKANANLVMQLTNCTACYTPLLPAHPNNNLCLQRAFCVPVKSGLRVTSSSVQIALAGGSQSTYPDLKLQPYLKTEVSEYHFLPLYLPNPEFKVQQREW